MKRQDDVQKAKQAAGKAAAEFVQNGMLVGLGTGSTASFFIERLIERCQNDRFKNQSFTHLRALSKTSDKWGNPSLR